MQNNLNLLVLGCGNMGAALAAGYAEAYPAAQVLALDNDPESARRRLSGGSTVRVVATVADLGDFQPDVVILALKPQVLGTALDAFSIRCSSALVISVAAGVTAQRLSALLGDHRRIVRAMPNLPVVVRQGMSVLFGAAQSEPDRAAATAVFEAVGQVAWVDEESLIDAATAVAGSGPAYFFAMVEQLMLAGQASGLDAKLAALLARQTCIGAAALLAADTRDAATLKAAVCSPRGTTEAALHVMEQVDALPRVIRDSVEAARQRAIELAQS